MIFSYQSEIEILANQRDDCLSNTVVTVVYQTI